MMKHTLHPVDVHVGARFKRKRVLLGLSQTMVGEELGITFQQVQKYESGANRMGASRLYEASLVIQEPAAYFFSGLPGQKITSSSGLSVLADEVGATETLSADALETIRLFYGIKDQALRNHLKELLRSILLEKK